MRIHSDTLTVDDLHRAMRESGIAAEGVFLDGVMQHGSRTRRQAFEVSLRALPGRDRNGKARRAPNSGQSGAAGGKAATYDEWGFWLARLFEYDPAAVMSYYKSRDDFHRATRNAYRVTQEA